MRKAIRVVVQSVATLLLAACGGGGGGGGGGDNEPPPPPPSSGRNDTIDSATPLGNGTFSASISPSGDPNTVFRSDEDYYEIETTESSTVTVDINANEFGSPLDSVIEFVSANGTRLATCVAPLFNSPCVHDDEDLDVSLDSFLQIQVAGPTTFYIHVVDFSGNGRPDKTYDLVITGVN